MEKDLLRDMLFGRYFHIEDGILVSDLTDKLIFITEIWKQLHTLCEKNIRHFDAFSSLEQCKMIEHNQQNYLVLKMRMWRYLIVNINSMHVVNQSEFEKEFDENFFVNNFNETKESGEIPYTEFYRMEKYSGNIEELVRFYFTNKDILSLSTNLYCKLEVDSSWTWIHIDFANANVQMGFQTPNQNLYEQLFLNYDLTPYGMQDAQQKMGIEKMKGIFAKMKDIKIPKECIPRDLYQQYLFQCNISVGKNMTKVF